MVQAVFPAPGSIAIPPPAPLQLTFDRSMNHGSVEENLSANVPIKGDFEWNSNEMTFTPEEHWPQGMTVTVTLSTAARSSLALPLSEVFIWSFKTAPTLLAYLWPWDGVADLYMVDPLSGDGIRLTETEYGLLDFSLAPDRLSLLLSVQNNEGGSDIQELNLLDRSLEMVFECGQTLCQQPQFDPEGQMIVFEDSTLNQIGLLAGEDEPILIGAGRFPSWSTDGKLLFYDPVQSAYQTFTIDRGVSQVFPNQTGEPGVWSPAGTFFLAPEIVPSDVGDALTTSHLFRYSLNGGSPDDLTINPNAEDATPSFSLGGDFIAFGRKLLNIELWSPGRQLWVQTGDGRSPQALTDAPLYNHTAFAWHPGGGQIAFVRSNQADLNEAPEIWLLDVDGTQPIRLVISGYAPLWIP